MQRNEPQPGEFAHHELLHTAHILSHNWSTFIVDHPACQQNPTLHAEANKSPT